LSKVMYSNSTALSNPAMRIVLGVPGTSGEYDSEPKVMGRIFVPFRTYSSSRRHTSRRCWTLIPGPASRLEKLRLSAVGCSPSNGWWGRKRNRYRTECRLSVFPRPEWSRYPPGKFLEVSLFWFLSSEPL
jgi:hypothetical protein